MAKRILFNEEARSALRRGVDIAGDAVRITLGPRGRNVIFDKGFGAPTITNDGVSIAKEIELKDKFENMGAEIAKEVANKTNDVAGDGTTTSVVLLQAMVSEGFRKIAMGLNPMATRAGIERALADVVAALHTIATPIKGRTEIEHVATISAESEEIGKKIAETFEKVGEDGVVTVEESQSFGVESEVALGLEFDKGYVSPYMITNTERMEAEYREVSILITDKKIASVQEILPLLEKLAQSGKKELVIIADDVEGEALTTFVVNKLRGAFSILAVKAPGYGDRKKEMLQDIATTTGGQVISEDRGVKLENAEVKMLGKAGRVVATKESTLIVNGKGKKSDIDERVAQLRRQLEQTDSKFDKEKIQERIGKLSGGVAVIRVGAATETEMKYKKLKIEDAVNATRAAIKEGVVPGGGTALVKVLEKLEGKKSLESLSEEERAGYEIVLRSLSMPLRQIAVNAGKGDGSLIVHEVRKGKGNAGYDAKKDQVIPDMIAAGIIDPVKVTRSAIENAASAAGILLTTEAAIAEEPKEEKGDNGAGMGGGMPGMM
ncbi:MAG: chaperonin GroEL [Parcubacteria group bacterium]|nr:chaperonin GroEL [Parcubacteria group bacterium]